MSDRANLFRGVVKNGVVIPDPKVPLPEGATVEMAVLPEGEFTPEERAEFEGWEKIGDEAWAMIDQWEQEEEQNAPPVNCIGSSTLERTDTNKPDGVRV